MGFVARENSGKPVMVEKSASKAVPRAEKPAPKPAPAKEKNAGK